VTIQEGQRGRTEKDGIELAALLHRCRIATRFHRHGDRILIPVAHAAYAARKSTQTAVEPHVGFGNGLTIHSSAGNVAAPVGDTSQMGDAFHSISVRMLYTEKQTRGGRVSSC